MARMIAITTLYHLPERGPRSNGRQIDDMLRRFCKTSLRWGNDEEITYAAALAIDAPHDIEGIVNAVVFRRSEGTFDNGRRFS
jgi:hypothetical protein